MAVIRAAGDILTAWICELLTGVTGGMVDLSDWREEVGRMERQVERLEERVKPAPRRFEAYTDCPACGEVSRLEIATACPYAGRMGTPEHECRQGHRCKSRIRDAGGKWHGAGVERGGTLCRNCETHAFNDIRRLNDDQALLHAVRLQQGSRVSGPKVTGSSQLPIPLNLGIDTLLADIDTEADRWARRLPGEHHDDLTTICTQLGTLIDLPKQRVTVWRPHPDGGDDPADEVLDGVDAVLRLARLHHRAQSVLGLIETTAWLNESCHVCGYRMLTMSIEHSLIQCRNCRNCWDQDEFARLNNPLAVA